MGRELWGSRSIGELTQRQADSIRSKRKVRSLLLLKPSLLISSVSHHQSLIWTGMLPETSVILKQLSRLITHRNFVIFIPRESFKSQILL
jgi:hypothetical protein